MLEPGQRLGERYLLLQRLGAGGMGEVWLASLEGDGEIRRRVVIKCVPPERADDDRLSNMLHDEARILGLLHHPGIVSPPDFIESERGSILVLEHVDGPSLRAALKHAFRNQVVLPEILAAWIGAEVARALEVAHTAFDEKGKPLHLVHRDVSPDNVLLSRDGRVRLADFGVARALGNTDITNPGSAPKGKRGYMAPEQAAGQPVGPTADQFSLARVIAEAADLQCGPKLRAVLDRATEARAADRFPSAQAFADALAQAVPPPPDAQALLAAWLQIAAADAFAPADSSGANARGAGSSTKPPSLPRKPFLLQLETDGKTRGIAESRAQSGPDAIALAPRLDSPLLLATKTPLPSASALRRPVRQLFADVDEPARARSRRLRLIAATGVLAALVLPLAIVLAQERGISLGRAILGMHAPSGDLQIGSRPDGAEVYVDGKLRGLTPIALHLPAGRHAVRVGSLRLERWRAAEVEVRAGVEKQLEIDLNE